MKTILLILISLFILSCSARTKNISKEENQTSFNLNTELKSNTSVSNTSVSNTDFKSLLNNNNLKIKSTGQNYVLKYGDLIFSGSADLDFSNKKEETIIHHISQIHTTYITEKIFKTQTTYKTKIKAKQLSVKRSGVTFGSMIWIIISSLFFGAVLSHLLIQYIKK